MKQGTVTVNGVVYDKYTGIVLRNDRIKRDTTAPASLPASRPIHHQLKTHKSMDFAPRQTVRRVDSFNAHPATIKPMQKPAAIQQSVPQPVKHPSVVRAEQAVIQKRAAKAPVAHTPAQVLKKQAIETAMATPKAPAKLRMPKSKKQRGRTWKHASLFATSAGILLLGGYFTYLYMPNLSVRVAATQAGIDAKYPGYRPDGYSLDGPVAFSQGEVKLSFLSNSANQRFAITQSTSAWDSNAVLDNYVKPQAGNNYTTNRENGLTIYRFNNQASWVNNGILYSIAGDAPLSGEQISKMALSL